jgi:hypothetical protein
MRTLVAAVVLATGVLAMQPAPVVGHHAVRIAHTVAGMFDAGAELDTSRVEWIGEG